jgi:hypothetical protein
MNEMSPVRDYRDDRNYRDDYRDYRDYREDYRDEYGRNQRDRRYNRSYRDRYGRNYRSQEEFSTMLEDICEDGMELARSYEDASDMTNNNTYKNKLMKMAEREKEHYRTIKDMLENRM